MAELRCDIYTWTVFFRVMATCEISARCSTASHPEIFLQDEDRGNYWNMSDTVKKMPRDFRPDLVAPIMAMHNESIHVLPVFNNIPWTAVGERYSAPLIRLPIEWRVCCAT